MNLAEYDILHRRLVSVREKMKSAAVAWRNAMPASSVRHGIDFVCYGTRSVLELFIEISSPGGQYVCWWVDLENREDGFHFEASLRKNLDGQENGEWEKSGKHQSMESVLALVEDLMENVRQEASISGSSIFQ